MTLFRYLRAGKDYYSTLVSKFSPDGGGDDDEGIFVC